MSAAGFVAFDETFLGHDLERLEYSGVSSATLSVDLTDGAGSSIPKDVQDGKFRCGGFRCRHVPSVYEDFRVIVVSFNEEPRRHVSVRCPREAKPRRSARLGETLGAPFGWPLRRKCQVHLNP